MTRCLLLWVGFILSVTALASGREVLVIDSFEYPSTQLANERWKAVEDSSPVTLQRVDGGSTALRIACSFDSTGPKEVLCELSLPLDLTKYYSIEFDLYLPDPILLKDLQVRLHSGNGWYQPSLTFWGTPQEYRPTTTLPKGWRRVVLERTAFKPVGKPAGLDKIDAIRISAVKNVQGKTFCLIDNLQACIHDIALVEGASEMRPLVKDTLGLPVDRLDAKDVEKGLLKGHSLAIFTDNPTMSDQQINRIREFTQAGGKIIVFGPTPEKLQALLGIRKMSSSEWSRKGQFANIVFEPGALTDLPDTMIQDSSDQIRQIYIPAELEPTARIIGRWQDAEGKIGEPAVVLSPNGAYFGQRLHKLGNENVRAFMLELLGHFVPDVPTQSADYALAKALQIGPFSDFAGLEDYFKTYPKDEKRRQETTALLASARAKKSEVESAMRERNYRQVVAQASQIREPLVQAYMLSHQPMDGEMRGGWMGVREGPKPAEGSATWTELCRRLAELNFNAIFPNIHSAGVARYPSKILPTRDLSYGDHLAECVAAGKKYGIEVHVWKVNFFMVDAPSEFREKMRKEGRVMLDVDGKQKPEREESLCPSHPANFDLERQSMLEVVRNYDVDGIHFDYIRYIDDRFCYCAGCRERFEAYRDKPVQNWPMDCYNGPLKSEYREWRVLQISRLVEAVSTEARRIKPFIKISAAVFTRYPKCREELGQDWVQWIKEGWIDFLCPMDYRTDDIDYMRLVATQVGQVAGRVPIYAGIAEWELRHEPDRIAGQIVTAREAGADGFVLFVIGQDVLTKSGPLFAQGLLAEKAVLPHQAPVIEFNPQVDNDEPVVVCRQDVLPMEVKLVSLGARALPTTGATGRIELQDMEGKTLVVLAKLPAVGQSVPVTIKRTQGVFRLATVGELSLQDGISQRFVRRSRPYRFAAEGQ